MFKLNVLCIQAKARCGSVKQSSFSGLVCSGLHSISGAQWLSGSAPRFQASKASLSCVLEQEIFILA